MGQEAALGRGAGKKTARFGSSGLSGVCRVAVLVGAGLLVANCTGENKLTSKIDPKYGVSASPRVVKPGDPVPKGGGTYRVGKPYTVAGRVYTPSENSKYRSEGLASWYGDDFHGRLTANGEVFDMHSIAAAHPTLPMPSYVKVTNLSNNRSMVVRVNDRGPYHGNRVIDVSSRAADLLGFKRSGTARVRVEYVGRAPLEGSDDMQLASTLRQDGRQVVPTTMLASAGSALPTRMATPATRVAAANVPLPPSRPFELGEPSAEDVAEAPVAGSRVASAYSVNPVRVSTRPAQQAAAVVAPPAPAPQQVAFAPLPPKPAAKPVAPARPAAVATAPAPRPAAPARQVPATAPAAVAQMAPQPTQQQALAASGWVVGAQPVMSYSPSQGSAATGQGLY
ncbi:septal ring lytic transglycosylase RlpA family protein [Ancylobacter oerskovii]|uniref:Endolytic peptidoglycan transglycosylase RlpA n=1 Tax=Ancylobacter oerskovii TaxID=459519 RepID=A0ABW4Z1D1_9HYPH|nr:septal ring lytic transglycosylase RlpA family protein [Ancylobacter oerskovii]MBS7542593.1 septal ring lytic transglycosylase RlpA family protein [Ancylobacter oerskovii]